MNTMSPHSAHLEALLFVAGEAVDKKTLAQALEISLEELARASTELAQSLSGRGLTLIDIDDVLDLRASASSYEPIKRLRELELSQDLGKASLETLAIILYRRGATRKDIDFIRGVNSTTALRMLLLRGLVTKEELASDKRTAFYKATPDALAHLGVSSLEELPRFEEFSQTLKQKEVVVLQEEV